MKNELISKLKKGLIVSCQALPGEPLFKEEGGIMNLMALAAKNAGAVGIRAQGVQDIQQIKATVELPVIGIIKKNYPDYEPYITATMNEVDELVAVGSDIIAIDATLRKRGNGKSINEYVAAIKEKYPNILLMADISTLEEAINAEKAGCDFVGTTMNGYTKYTEHEKTLNLKLIQDIVQHVSIPVIAEGKIHSPQQAKLALDAGAHCVVVGGAITRPQEIAQRFINEIKCNS